MNLDSSETPFREIEENDLDAVAARLTMEFPRHNEKFWEQGLERLANRAVPAGQPRFGAVLDDDGIKGVMLTIASSRNETDGPKIITNASSWCVAKTHRGPSAKALYAYAIRGEGVTYSSISAAPHVIKSTMSLGFTRWTAGQLCGIGTSATGGLDGILGIDQAAALGLTDAKAKLLEDHAQHGCLSFCLRIGERLAPFVFLKRRIKGILPLAQMIYCEIFEDFTAHSRRINGHLAASGYPLMLVDSNGSVPGMRGRYFAGKAPKFYKGPPPKAAVDHAYSEMIYIGL